MFVAFGSLNWNWPGGSSIATPSIVQLLRDNAGFVEAKTLKTEPKVFVKEIWYEPAELAAEMANRGGEFDALIALYNSALA
jgi:hypothetical protein